MWTVLALIGIGLFVASIVLEKKASLDAEGGPAGIVIPLRGWGVVAATVGLVAMCILAAVNGGFFASPPAA
jgi:hypothetical protein